VQSLQDKPFFPPNNLGRCPRLRCVVPAAHPSPYFLFACRKVWLSRRSSEKRLNEPGGIISKKYFHALKMQPGGFPAEAKLRMVYCKNDCVQLLGSVLEF
jgi:hypothetical protein